MIFDYQTYFVVNCRAPLLTLALLLAISVIPTISMIKACKRKKLKPPYDRIAITVIVAIAFCAPQIPVLYNGGIYLLTEKEEDAVTIDGQIEKTEENEGLYANITNYRDAAKWNGTLNNSGYGEYIYVEGQKYSIITYGDMKVGDQVRMRVLPKSKFVLSMERVNDETETVENSGN